MARAFLPAGPGRWLLIGFVALCLAGGTLARAGTVSGLVRYEDRPVTRTGYGTNVFQPCRFNQVELLRSDSVVLGTGATNASGNFTITIPDSGSQTVFLRVYAQQLSGNYRLIVYNNSTAQAIQTARTANQTINTNLASTINMDLTVSSTAAGAFNIFDQGVRAQDTIRAVTGAVPPRLTFFWQPNSTDGTYFSPSENAIHLIGGPADPDEFDDDVILHETGHYVLANFSRDDSPAGQHSQADTHQDLRLAWSEGWGYYWSSSVSDSPEQHDYTTSGVSYFEIETPTNGTTATGADTETSVESILWDLSDTASTPDLSAGTDDDGVSLADGKARILDVVRHQVTASFDATLENFYAGWFREHGTGFQKAGFDALLTARGIDFNRPHLFVSTGSAVSIPDGSSQVESTVSVPLSMNLTAVRVMVGVDHRTPSQLVVRVVHPDGTAVTLHNRTSTASGDIFNWYEPNDTTPASTLSAFNGKNGSGTWRLQVQDAVSGTQGTLEKWRLSLHGAVNAAELQMASVSGPASCTPGSSIAVSSRVENRGTSNITANFSCAYMLSLDSTITSADTPLGSYSVNGLNASEGVNDSRNVTIPAATAIGNYFLGAIADTGGVVTESDENNNSRASTSQLRVDSPSQPPDLVVASVSAPASGLPGQSLALACRIENQGTLGVSASFSNRYVLSLDSAISAADTGLATFTASSLAAGQGLDDSRSAAVPAAVAPNTYFVGVIADAGGSVAESNETNNTRAASAATVIGSPPSAADLSMLQVLGPRSASTAATVLVTLAYQNLGGTAIPGIFASGIYLSPNNQVTVTDIRLATFSTSGLAAGQRVDRAVAAVIPSSLAQGTYFLGAILDTDSAVAESREDNNTGVDTGGVFVSPPPTQPDLLIYAVETAPGASQGRTLAVTADLANNGGSSIAANFLVRFLLSRTRTPLVPVALPTDLSVSGLGASGTRRLSAALTVPVTLAVGSYYVGVIADPTNVVTEGSEDNNSMAPSTPVSVTVRVIPDLAVLGLDHPAIGFLGARMTVTPRLTNRGNGSSGAFSNEYLLAASLTPPATGISLGLVPFASLSAGETRTAAVSLSIPSAVAQGNYHLAVRADAGAEVTESDETNNVLVTTSTVQLVTPVLPDLAVLTVDGPSQAEAGAQISVHRTMRNQGSAALTQNFFEAVVISTSSTVSAASQRLATFPVAPLAISAVSDLSRLVFVPATLAQGSYFLGVVADPDGQIVEMSEENNAQAAVAPTVVALSRKPDLVLVSVSTPASISTTLPFLLTRTVRNGSQFGTARGFQEVVYLSVDTQITTADTPIATFLGPELAPGATSTTTRSVSLPQGTPSGAFYVGLIVDPSGALDEVTHANNAAATASTVNILGSSTLPDLVPTDLITPFQATAASSMDLQRSISNRGRGSVISAFNESYYMSSGADVTTTNTLVATFPNGALGAGGVSVESRQLAIPSTMPPGDYWLLLQVDPENRIAEADSTGNALAAEANNGLRSLARIQVGGAAGSLPDLTAASVSAPVEVRRGVAANVTCEVANQGSAVAASFTVRFYLSLNRTVEVAGSDVLLGTRSTAPLAVGGRTMLQAFLTVPATQATGNYFILAEIDPSNAIPELVETNNLGVSSQVTVSDTLTLADLVADSLAFSPSRLEPGGTLSLTWRIRNVGGRPSPPFRLQFFASGDTAVGSPDPLLASLELPTLAAGESLSDVTTAALPATVTTGAYFVGMAADGDARIVEADERNNSVLAPGTLSLGGVLGGADLSGVQVSTPTSATIGGPMLLVLEVRNNGPVAVTGNVVNRVWLSSDSVVDGADRKLDEFTLAGVGATAIVTASRTVFIPRLPPGSYHVLFAVDATNAAAEEIETNNVSDRSILLRGAPDLRLDGFVAPTSTLQAGIPFPVQLLVSNGGNAVAQGPILCRVLLSFDGVLDPSDLVLRPIIYPGNLAVGAQASLDTTAAVPDYVSPGNYRLIAVVDPTQTVLEEDESNNVWVQPGPISLGGAADLRAYGVQAPASAVAGGGTELLLAVSVQNTGAATAAACDTGFFLSTDRTINASDTFLGSVRAPRLLPGEVAVVQGGFVLPGAFPAGSYYVIARADTGNTVPELDESSASNDASAPGLVTVVAASTERARVVRYSTSAARPDAVPAGPVTLSVEYDRPLASAPRASVDQPGTNDLPASPMSGSGRTWSIVYSVPSDNRSFNLDGTNRFSVSGGADSFGLQAEGYTTAAAFVTDTIAPSVRFTYPAEGAVVGGGLLVTGTVADASGGGRVLLSSTGGATQEVAVSAGRFEQQVALAAELATIVARASDPAGNPSVEARVTVRLDGDGDGMPNDWERLYGLNSADPSDASGDPDLDGLSSLQEFRSGTAPFVADTDGDGAGDGLEVAQGTDPVHGSNRPPVTRAREGAASALDPSPRVATLDGTASIDDDGDPVRYAWSQVSGASCQLLRTDTATPAAVVRAAGTYVFRLVTSDGKSNGLPGDVSVSVSNVTPTADAGAEQVVAVGGVVRLDGSGSTDPNGDVLSYSWSENAANPTLGLLSGGSGAGPTFTPTRAGKYEFLLRVTDPAGLVSRVAKTSARVFEPGLVMAPRADAGLDETVDAGTVVRLDGHESVDPDGSLFSVAYLWTQTAGPPGATRLNLLGATTVNPSFTPTAAGIYTFQLTVRDVSDDGLESAPDWVEIRVNSPADPLPLAVAGADRTSALGETVVLDGSGSVARGGGVLVFQWSQVAGPPAKLELADQAMALVTPLQAGSYAFELLVTEGNVNGRKSRVWVHVPEGTGGGPPAAKARMASPQSSLASENRVRIPAGGSVTVTLDGTASFDPSGAALRYSWRQTVGPSAVLSSESAARPTFSPLVSRVYGFELTVSNGWLQATTGIEVAVDSPFNSVPMASVATVSAVKPGATVTFDGSRSSDPDGGSLLYRWVQTGGLPVTLTGATTARPSFTPPAAGLYKFQLYVDDGRDRSIPTEFTVLASQSGSGTGSTGSTGQPAGSDSGGGGGCAAVAGAGRGTGAWPVVLVLVWLGVRRRRVTWAGGWRRARE